MVISKQCRHIPDAAECMSDQIKKDLTFHANFLHGETFHERSDPVFWEK